MTCPVIWYKVSILSKLVKEIFVYFDRDASLVYTNNNKRISRLGGHPLYLVDLLSCNGKLDGKWGVVMGLRGEWSSVFNGKDIVCIPRTLVCVQ